MKLLSDDKTNILIRPPAAKNQIFNAIPMPYRPLSFPVTYKEITYSFAIKPNYR